MIRSLKFSLSESNPGKLQGLDDLWFEYRKLVQSFFMRLKSGKGLDESYLKRLDTVLSYRYRQCAKRQSMKSWKSWCRAKGRYDKKIPSFRTPQLVLDQRFVTVSPRGNSFDLWIDVSSLNSGTKIRLPIRSYDYANRYIKDWSLVNGCRLNKRGDDWYVTLSFRKDSPENPVTGSLGVDIGYRKTVATSDGGYIGNIKSLCEKKSRKKRGSRAEVRCRSEIRNHVGYVVNRLVDGSSNIVIEELKNLKKNKRGKWSKNVNRKFHGWYYPLIVQRIRNRCEVVGVQCHSVDPSYTSQDCPECGHRDSLSRRNEEFRCTRCGYTSDADLVGARNILGRFLRRCQETIVPDVQSWEPLSVS